MQKDGQVRCSKDVPDTDAEMRVNGRRGLSGRDGGEVERTIVGLSLACHERSIGQTIASVEDTVGGMRRMSIEDHVSWEDMETMKFEREYMLIKWSDARAGKRMHTRSGDGRGATERVS